MNDFFFRLTLSYRHCTQPPHLIMEMKHSAPSLFPLSIYSSFSFSPPFSHVSVHPVLLPSPHSSPLFLLLPCCLFLSSVLSFIHPSISIPFSPDWEQWTEQSVLYHVALIFIFNLLDTVISSFCLNSWYFCVWHCSECEYTVVYSWACLVLFTFPHWAL